LKNVFRAGCIGEGHLHDETFRRVHGGFLQFFGVHFSQPLKALHIDLGAPVLLEKAFFFRIGVSVKGLNLFPGPDP